MDAVVYVAWVKRSKRPLYIGSSTRGVKRALENVTIRKRMRDILYIDLHYCSNYSRALSLEARLCWKLKPTMDKMIRKPIPRKRQPYQGKISATVNPFS